MSFEDRLSAESYADDPAYEVRLVPHGWDAGVALEPSAWIPERLMTRLIHLAHAYELPLLQRLPRGGQPAEESWTYPEAQFARLEEEWAFLAERLADPLLSQALAPALRLIAHGLAHPRGWSLSVESP